MTRIFIHDMARYGLGRIFVHTKSAPDYVLVVNCHIIYFARNSVQSEHKIDILDSVMFLFQALSLKITIPNKHS